MESNELFWLHVLIPEGKKNVMKPAMITPMVKGLAISVRRSPKAKLNPSARRVERGA